MYRRKSNHFSAFTLIELMVVVAIIAVLAALIVPALQKAQTAAAARSCMAKIRGFPAAFRAYAASWDGWTNKNPDHYMSLIGFSISTEPAYYNPSISGAPPAFNPALFARTKSENAQSKTLVCPVDGKPAESDNGVKTSYRISGDFVGANIMAMTGDANTILCGIERAALHPVPGELTTRLEKHYSYADGTASLGYNGPALPGAIIRLFQGASFTPFQISEGELPNPVAETTISSGTHLMSTGQVWVDLAEQTGLWPKDAHGGHSTRVPVTEPHRSSHLNKLTNAVVRIDGIIKFPQTGNWILGTYHDAYDRNRFAISTTSSGNPNSVAEVGSWKNGGHHWQGSYAHSLEIGRQTNHGAARNQKITISDIASPYIRFTSVFATSNGEIIVSRPQGVVWYLSDPNSTTNPKQSSVGGLTVGQPVPMSNIFRLP